MRAKFLKLLIILRSLDIKVFGIKWEKFVTNIFSGAFLTSWGLLTINTELDSFSRSNVGT